MDAMLTAAGVISVFLAAGHAAIGLRWVLPALTQTDLPATRFGGRSTTFGMVRISWHIITLFAAASGGLLLNLAAVSDADPRTLLLRWFAAMWVAAAIMAWWLNRARLRNLLAHPFGRCGWWSACCAGRPPPDGAGRPLTLPPGHNPARSVGMVQERRK